LEPSGRFGVRPSPRAFYNQQWLFVRLAPKARIKIVEAPLRGNERSKMHGAD
jgi:hypothetical protein